MSMGEEETKGSELVREVHEALKASSLNFVGNVEGHDIFTGKVDVVVMDGFTGNVVLKAIETLAEFVIELIRAGGPARPARAAGRLAAAARRSARRGGAATRPRSAARRSWACRAAA